MKLSSLPGVLIKDVATALDIHPFMFSLWRKQVRDGVIVAKSAVLGVQTVAELRRLRELERRYKLRAGRARLRSLLQWNTAALIAQLRAASDV